MEHTNECQGHASPPPSVERPDLIAIAHYLIIVITMIDTMNASIASINHYIVLLLCSAMIMIILYS